MRDYQADIKDLLKKAHDDLPDLDKRILKKRARMLEIAIEKGTEREAWHNHYVSPLVD